ncbi:MAG: sulfatase-like hydrolase/transferase [Thermoanaerobaculia bacterium]
MPDPKDRPRVRSALVAVGLAPAALYLYFAFEWLFLVTGASPLAAQPFGTQLRALAGAPIPMLAPLLGVQLLLSVISVLHHRLRHFAVIPGAIILGVIALMLIDNFTYTLTGFGIVKTGPIMRLFYVAGLTVLIGIAAMKLTTLVSRLSALPLRALTVVATIIVLLGAAPALARTFEKRETWEEWNWGSSVRARPNGPALPNILVLGSDGLDAAYLSVYGYPQKTTPFLEEIRSDSLFFENAFTNVGHSRGALVTLLTGRLPTETKVFYPPTSVQGDGARWHLPGMLKARGYTTLQLGMRYYADAADANLVGAFDAANYRWEKLIPGHGANEDQAGLLRASILERVEERVLHMLGLRRMVDHFAELEGVGDNPYLRDSRRVETLLRYFREAPEPWFVHVHMVDTHCCNPKADRIFFRTGSPRDDHDNVIRNADERFRTLVEALRVNGQLDRTVVVITSDHPYRWGSTSRIPLMIRFPRGTPRGKIVNNAQLADVAPTLLDYLGVEAPPWMDGASWLAPETLRRERPIFGIAHTDMARENLSRWNRVIIDAGPPNYGATVASLVVGGTWYKLDLRDGTVTSGQVPGHTRPHSVVMKHRDAAGLLLRHVLGAGFEIARSAKVDGGVDDRLSPDP